MTFWDVYWTTVYNVRPGTRRYEILAECLKVWRECGLNG
jgi:hypothetical protein